MTIRYDDGKSATPPGAVAVRTDADGYFAAPVEVDGSDGRTHNATSVVIRVNENVTADLRVPTAPYALVAASAEYVDSKEAAALPGNANSVNLMLVDGGVVAEALTLGGDFAAGTVQGNGAVHLSGVTLKGGSLEWLGGSEGSTFATLSTAGVTYSGGDKVSEGRIDGGSADSDAEYDGFCQVTLTGRSANNGKQLLHAGLKVNGLVVTPTGYYDQDAASWTVPVRKGEKVVLSGSGAYRFNFIYFGKGK